MRVAIIIKSLLNETIPFQLVNSCTFLYIWLIVNYLNLNAVGQFTLANLVYLKQESADAIFIEFIFNGLSIIYDADEGK